MSKMECQFHLNFSNFLLLLFVYCQCFLLKVKKVSGSSMSNREIKQAVALANQVADEENSAQVDQNDVQIVAEIIDMLDAEDNPDELELISVMTKAASQDISTENSEKVRFGDTNSIEEPNEPVTDHDASEIANMINQLGADCRDSAIILYYCILHFPKRKAFSKSFFKI